MSKRIILPIGQTGCIEQHKHLNGETSRVLYGCGAVPKEERSIKNISEYYREKLIEYIDRRGNIFSTDKFLKYVMEQKTLENAIDVAVRSLDKNGKKQSHQKRLKNSVLSEFGHIVIVSEKEKINNAKTFDELYKIIKRNKIDGVGEMLEYDVSIRIGCYLQIYPERIYLHTGTRKGIENLYGHKINKNYLYKNELPDPFNNCDLTPGQLEDFFCIYKEADKQN
jgi:hypothetical protein